MNEEQLSKKCANLIGQKFNRLTVLELDHIEHKYISSKHGYSQRPYWKCRCECGNIKIVSSASLRNGHTKSCGCYKNERIREFKHKRNVTQS